MRSTCSLSPGQNSDPSRSASHCCHGPCLSRCAAVSGPVISGPGSLVPCLLSWRPLPGAGAYRAPRSSSRTRPREAWELPPSLSNTHFLIADFSRSGGTEASGRLGLPRGPLVWHAGPCLQATWMSGLCEVSAQVFHPFFKNWVACLTLRDLYFFIHFNVLTDFLLQVSR